ncbi:hypothetical protein ACQPZF_16550 [Actinosynnema sp. CS-041913]|uniref:hypothetical protein n=1 Tax=Actinosynnema sp. CS-041913 TaxID=3239917 RepID=UPI003D8C3FA5
MKIRINASCAALAGAALITAATSAAQAPPTSLADLTCSGPLQLYRFTSYDGGTCPVPLNGSDGCNSVHDTDAGFRSAKNFSNRWVATYTGRNCTGTRNSLAPAGDSQNRDERPYLTVYSYRM